MSDIHQGRTKTSSREQTIQGGVKEVIYAQTEQPFQNRWLPKTPTITQFWDLLPGDSLTSWNVQPQ